MQEQQQVSQEETTVESNVEQTNGVAATAQPAANGVPAPGAVPAPDAASAGPEAVAKPEKILNYVSVIPAEDIKPGGSRSVMIGRREIAIFRIGDEFYAIDNSCSHYGAALCTGWVKDKVVTCPWHCWQFDVTNGNCLTVPSRGIGSYPVRIEEGSIQIGIES
jgi:NAD(P)H-dependent nitrite reductase small subunit